MEAMSAIALVCLAMAALVRAAEDSAGLAPFGSVAEVGAKHRMWYRAQSNRVTFAGPDATSIR
jgi:hypothetical protein